MTTKRSIRALPCVFVLLFIGCFAEPSATLTGTVTFNGEPLSTGAIVLKPAEGRSRSTRIDNGDYRFGQEKELVPGNYAIELRAYRETGKTYRSPDPAMVNGEPDFEKPRPMIKEQEQYLPRKYNRDSNLQIELASGINEKDFNLDK